ncbi:MAG: hypothetical protein D6815_10460, partial [Candidatus Dadabacteria bacterium]
MQRVKRFVFAQEAFAARASGRRSGVQVLAAAAALVAAAMLATAGLLPGAVAWAGQAATGSAGQAAGVGGGARAK